MMPPDRNLPGLNEWQAIGLQLIVFPVDPTVAIRRDWWGTLTHTPAEDVKRRQIERSESGTYNDFRLTVATDLQKISWMINAEVQADALLEAPPAIGDYVAVRDRFRDMMIPWLAEECPEIKRIGFGGAIIQPMPDHEAAYQRLDAYLSVVQVDSRSTDFSYTVNRPTRVELNIPDLTVNRLSTWAALKFQSSYRVLSPAGPPQPAAMQRDLYACMMQFDVNTSADRTEPLPRERLPDLFRELIAKATEIAEQGDHP